jgi:hypothetical protein
MTALAKLEGTSLDLVFDEPDDVKAVTGLMALLMSSGGFVIVGTDSDMHVVNFRHVTHVRVTEGVPNPFTDRQRVRASVERLQPQAS